MSEIEDPETARAILAKVNAMNLDTVIKVSIPVAAFALLPQFISAPLAGVLALGSLLYAAQGKLLSE